MSNIIGDLLWNYITSYLQIIIDIPKDLIKWLAKGAIEEAKREIALKSIDENQFKDPDIKAAVIKLKAAWQHSPEGSADIARDLINIVSGHVAKLQLERVSQVLINDDLPISNRLFDEMAVLTDYSILTASLKVIGSLIPTTNAQYMGIALDDYMDKSGMSQITGFGYGMLFSNVISPLMAYELNTKVRSNIPAGNEALMMGYKELLPEAEVNLILAKQGFSDALITAMRENGKFYPGAQDLIRFATRDTFREDIVSKYGYDTEYPVDIDAYATKGGVPPFWMKHYWRAHWNLPSVNMAYEMLHRGKINVDEMRTLLKIDDMAPWWIQKLIDISYSPYTRVDTRRLYTDGLLTRDEVKQNYLDIGYDDEHAEKLTAWTCKAVSGTKKEQVKQLSEASMMRAYKFGQKSVSDLSRDLKTLGYDDEEIKELIAIADYANYESELKAEYKILKAEYLAGIVDDGGITVRLTELKLNQVEQAIWRRGLTRDLRLQEIKEQVAAEKAASVV